MSRPHFCQEWDFQIATPKSMSRPPILPPMSRPPILPPMSRHQIHVATPFLPTMGFPGRDAKLQVATSHIATHVATSKMKSRPQLSSAPFLLRRDAIFPCCDLPCRHPCRNLKMMSRHQFPLAKIPGRPY